MDKKYPALEEFARADYLSAIERLVLENLSPLEKFALNERLVRDENERESHKAYIRDMIAFKSPPPKVPSFVQACDILPDALSLHGFSYSYQVDQDSETITVTCQITHHLGHSESTSYSVPVDWIDDSSALRYLQGMVLTMLTGLIPEDELALS